MQLQGMIGSQDPFPVGLNAGKPHGFRAGGEKNVLRVERLSPARTGRDRDPAFSLELSRPLEDRTLFFFIRKATPLLSRSTMAALRFCTAGKSTCTSETLKSN